MRASFERGDPSAPRGHALVFFRDSTDLSQLRACYLVVAPISMDLARYVPPMFAAQLAGLMPSGPTALPLPPVPEPVESLAWLERVAEARHDDLLDGGQLDPNNPQAMMLATSELAAEYAALWADYAGRLPDLPQVEAGQPAALPDVDDILFELMSDSEKIARLAKLAGTLRYAVEATDQALTGETVEQMERIGRRLSPNYRLTELLAVGRRPGPPAAHLLELYVERCYKLAAEDYQAVESLDREITRLAP